MNKIKWIFITLVTLIVIAFFHYVLPQHDIARITSTEIIRTDFSGFNRLFYAQADSGGTENPTRDIRLVNSVRDNGKIMVYRNEDTGWIWPPYFKFDSSNLHAESADLISSRDAPVWVSVTHYGWRNEFFSIYPNVVGVKEIAGPDVRIIPWFNIIFLTLLALVVFMLRKMWLQFRERSIDPMIEDMGDNIDAAGDRIGETKGRIGRWLDTWRKK